MTSSVLKHFPVVRYRNGQKQLFNPVSKQWVSDRPEERVRLRTIEFLTREAGFSLNRMNTEQGIRSDAGSSPTLRTDIICFDTFHQPLLLVECKSESIRLDTSVSAQSARYNRTVRAPYVMLTNGINDFFFAIREDEQAEVFSDFSRIAPLGVESIRDMAYWNKRGFTGHTDDHDLLSDLFTRFWSSKYAQNQYISMDIPAELRNRLPEFPDHMLSHYFRVAPRASDGSRSALTLIDDQKNGMLFIKVTANAGGQTKSVATWSVYDVSVSEKQMTLTSPEGNIIPVDLESDGKTDAPKDISLLYTLP